MMSDTGDDLPATPDAAADVRRICLVTAADSDEAIKWGLAVDRVALPTVVHCTPGCADLFRAGNPAVQVVTRPTGEPLSAHDRLALLREACAADAQAADAYFWADLPLLYQHLSFEFLHGDLLLRAVRDVGGGPAFFPMPGYPPWSFFGGRRAALLHLPPPPDDLTTLFECTLQGQGPNPPFRMAFGTGAVDLNLLLARLIDAPVVHVVGDSHVYNCLTRNAAIGCRQNVLMRTADVSPLPVPFAYQFSHHLGGRTMHHAGAPGALVALADECGVKAGDAVVWVFGEIDVRCHILKRHREDGRPLDEVIATLARRFIRGVRDVEEVVPRLRSIVLAPIPPLDNPDYTSDSLPVFGTIDERIEVTRRLRAVLREACAAHGIGYIEPGRGFETARGDLRWELSDHFCHVAYDYQAPLVAQLYALLSS